MINSDIVIMTKFLLRRCLYITFCSVICGGIQSVSAQSAGYVSSVWTPDRGDGTYRNPVIHADYSDPDVCVVGDDFYLTASSFNCAPGLPILHSKDLVNWEIVNYALKRNVPEAYYNEARHGKGVWAPSIRYHQGEYFIYWGDPDYGVYMVKARDPRGTWSEPVLVKKAKGIIDPCPLWDDDGKCYLAFAWAGSRAQINSVICVAEMNAEGTEVIGDARIVYDGNDDVNHTAEGPKFYKHNGYYYLLFPAGGVVSGWQMAARSRSVFGPYEAKRVMDQGQTKVNGPHQGGWVHTSAGEDWFLHFQDKGCYGRVVWLEPMNWKDGWPVIGDDADSDGCGNPVLTYRKPTVPQSAIVNPLESDEFNTTEWGLQWQWHSNYQDLYGFTTPYGYARLYSHKLSPDFVNLWEVPNMLLQKFPAETFTVTSRMKMVSKENGQEGGLIIMGWDYAALTVQRMGDRFILRQRICKDAEQGNKERISKLAEMEPSERQTIIYSPTVSRDIFLRIMVGKEGWCTFSYSLDGKTFMPCGEKFKARQGKWIGAKVGMVCIEPHTEPAVNRGWLDVDWFRVTANNGK